jgi:hypothetical protein
MQIFLSYRRDDSQGETGRLSDRLTKDLGEGSVFVDVDSIPPGTDFAEYITAAVARCDALLAIIGPRWLGARRNKQRRIDDPEDFVRIEVAAALQRKIPVIPILVDGAKIPSRDQLPPDLKALSLRAAVDVRHASFHSDIGRLIDTLKRIGAPANPTSLSPVPFPTPLEKPSDSFAEKQVQWFERAFKSIRLLAEKIQIASTFEENNADAGKLAELWQRVQSAQLRLDEAAEESHIYATEPAKKQVIKIAKEVQRVANKTQAFDPPLIPKKKREGALEEIYELSVYLQDELPSFAVEARRSFDPGARTENGHRRLRRKPVSPHRRRRVVKKKLK